jgi:hypothetical protein
MHRHADGDRLDLGPQRCRILAEIGLGQNDHRRGAAFPGGGEIALDAARVEVTVQRGDQEGHVDVGGDNLRTAGATCGLAHERTAPRQHIVDGGAPLLGADSRGYPVAGHRIGAGLRLMGEAPRELGGRLAHRGREPIEPALLHDHARGRETTRGVGLKLLLERSAPAVAVDQDGYPSVGKP